MIYIIIIKFVFLFSSKKHKSFVLTSYIMYTYVKKKQYLI